MNPVAVEVEESAPPGRRAGRAGSQGVRADRDEPATEESFSLQGNAKTIEGGRHPDRDAQFAHTNAAVEERRAAGQPLTSHEVIVNLIAGTTTRTGLTVTARLDDTTYPKSIKITVCRFPPGTSKWNKIEHCLFSQINPELRVLLVCRPY